MSERISLANTPAAPAQPGDADYSPPSELVPLPSKGKVYSTDSVFHDVESVEIRPMTTRDEDILSSRALLKQGKAIDALLKSCLIQRALVDPSQLLIGDRNAVLVAVRITGYGAEYKPEVECPKCDEKSRPQPPFDLAQMSIKPLGAEPITVGVNAFKFTLPLSKRDVVFKLLTGADERELSQILEQQKKKGSGPLGVEAIVTTRLWMHIVKIGEEEDRNKLMKVIHGLSPRDSRALRKHIEEISPGIDMNQKFVCPACGEESEVDAPMSVEFFWPTE
jgi:hypothetical protein